MRVLWLTFAIVVVDQVSKLLVKGISIPWLGINIQGMRYGYSTPVLGDFFRLTYIENPGMAFGIDIGGKLFFSIFSIILSIGILYYLYRERGEKLGFRISLALILGGAIGNLIDRTFYGVLFGEGPLFYGRVVDFFDVDFFNINILGYSLTRWPVFNVADAAVTIGIVLLLFVHRSHEAAPKDIPPPALQEISPDETRHPSPAESNKALR
ncbi:MAG: signal peptidase II [Bacteroidetes bacterium]|nr:signal peptidase II [Bacteroidota bacterium]MCW5895771.1 signal peptidase II [Bacteroidota bacterium]